MDNKNKSNQELERINALERLSLMDTPREEKFDLIIQITKELFHLPYVVFSLIDAKREWIKSKVGITEKEIPRELSFCNAVLEEEDCVVIEDLSKRPEFATHPFVMGEPHALFFAGYPVKTAGGYIVGVLYVMDKSPRKFLSDQKELLKNLSKIIEEVLSVSLLALEKEQAMHLLLSADSLIKDTDTANKRGRESSLFYETKIDLLCILGLDGKFQKISKGWESLFGFSENELLSKSVIDFVHVDDRKKVKTALEKMTKDKIDTSWECRFITKENKTRWLSWHASYVQGLIYAVIRDVSAQKDMANQFISNMSHVVRDPMNVIMGMVGLLLLNEITLQQKEYVETINESAEELMNVVNEVLYFLQLEIGKIEVEEKRFSIKDLCSQIIQENQPKAQSKKLNLIFEMDKDFPVDVIGDPTLINRVLSCLVDNAIKFTNEGEIVFRVLKKNETESYVQVGFVIKDSGIGISEENQKRLFDAFMGPESMKHGKMVTGSAGLSLASCKKIISNLEGTLYIESSEGIGTTFFCNLTLQKQDIQPVDNGERIELQKARILILNDKKQEERGLYKQLIDLNLKVDVESTAESALEKLKEEMVGKNPYHILIIDVKQPELKGIKFIEEIQEHPLLRKIHTCITTFGGQTIPSQKLQNLKKLYLFDVPIADKVLLDTLERSLAGLVPVTQAKKIDTGLELLAGKLSVLIVEDYVVNQKLVQLQLQKLGYQSKVAENGLEALEILERTQFDVVLMDCEMPKMNGYEATREIRRKEGADKHTLIIAMTANAMEGDREKCLEAGMDDYIGKPVKLDTLALTLAKWVNWSS